MDCNIPRLANADILNPDHDPRLGRAHDGRQQIACKLCSRHDDGTRTRILNYMRMIALCIGGVSRHGDAACRHDREISDAPFGAVF